MHNQSFNVTFYISLKTESKYIPEETPESHIFLIC